MWCRSRLGLYQMMVSPHLRRGRFGYRPGCQDRLAVKCAGVDDRVDVQGRDAVASWVLFSMGECVSCRGLHREEWVGSR